ncbi:MAG: hypothetical protein FGM46_04125 [Ferruginibacter sp.]|nr:hypothetical protein [Ferruginibacter sp.]
MSQKINIPEPCNQNWNQMSPTGIGRYCDTCKLTVVDFTKMSLDEIKNHLLNNSYVCGRFDCSQVETSHIKTLDLLKIKTKHIKYKPLRRVAGFLLLIPAVLYRYSGLKTLRNRIYPEELMGVIESPKKNQSPLQI